MRKKPKTRRLLQQDHCGLDVLQNRNTTRTAGSPEWVMSCRTGWRELLVDCLDVDGEKRSGLVHAELEVTGRGFFAPAVANDDHDGELVIFTVPHLVDLRWIVEAREPELDVEVLLGADCEVGFREVYLPVEAAERLTGRVDGLVRAKLAERGVDRELVAELLDPLAVVVACEGEGQEGDRQVFLLGRVDAQGRDDHALSRDLDEATRFRHPVHIDGALSVPIGLFGDADADVRADVGFLLGGIQIERRLLEGVERRAAGDAEGDGQDVTDHLVSMPRVGNGRGRPVSGKKSPRCTLPESVLGSAGTSFVSSKGIHNYSKK